MKERISEIFNHHEERFDRKVREIIEIFDKETDKTIRDASIRSLILELKKEFLDAHLESVTDDLTGFLNKKNIQHVFDRQLSSASRSKQYISVIAIDIDELKKINDRFGHTIGTGLIKATAEVISKSIRRIDVACRYGGDEFVLICIHNKKEGIDKVVNRIRKEVKNISLPENFIPTVSIGSTTLKADDDIKFSFMFDLADNRLYDDKKQKAHH